MCEVFKIGFGNYVSQNQASVCWFGVERSFETVFHSISDRLPEGKIEKKKGRREKKCPNNPHLHLMQAQQTLVLL